MSLLSETTSTVLNTNSVQVNVLNIRKESSIRSWNVPDLLLANLVLRSLDASVPVNQSGEELTVDSQETKITGSVTTTGSLTVQQGVVDDQTVYLPDLNGFQHILNFQNGLLTSVSQDQGFRIQVDTTLLSGTSSAANQFTLPLVDPVDPGNPRSVYNMVVFWGDGAISTVTQWNVGNTHTYAVPGIYNIIVLGACIGWQFNGLGDIKKILLVQNWGLFFRLGRTTVGHFLGCSNMNVTASDSLNLGTVPHKTTNMELSFSGCSSLTGIQISNTGNLTQTDGMFLNCSLFNADLSGWDVQNVQLMQDMFSGCTSFKQDLSAWKPYACLDMTNMFFGVDLNSPNSAANQTNYNNLLLSWGNNPKLPLVQSNVPFGGGLSQYSYIGSVLTARNNLKAKGWTFTDGGPVFVNNYFRMTVQTTRNGVTNSNSFRLPTASWGTYNCTVDWGDSTSTNITVWNVGYQHTYPAPGIYNITITGQFWGFQTSTSVSPWVVSDCEKIIEISEWGGDFRLGTNQGYYFNGCRFLIMTAITPPLLTGTTSLRYAFYKAVSLDISAAGALWDISQVTDLEGTFQLAVQFQGASTLASWNTRNVTNMKLTFAQQWSQPAVGGWDVSSVTTMESMFEEARYFNTNIGAWNVSNVTNMQSMFRTLEYFNNGNSDSIKNWNVSNVTTMNNMFYGCQQFNQPIGSWNISNNTSLRNMFTDCRVFDQDLGSWNTSLVTDMFQMFSNAFEFNNGTNPNLNWNTGNVTDMTQMFYQAFKFNRYIGSWNTVKVTTMEGMFQNLSWYNFTMAFNNSDPPTTVPGTKPLLWNTSSLTRCPFMFQNCTYFNQPLTTNGNIWNMTNVTDVCSMFQGQPSLKNYFNNGWGPFDNSHPMGWTFAAPPSSTDWRTNCLLTAGNKPASLP